VLRDCLRKTSYAISTDETRYVLNGILFSFKNNALTMVATDGRRLAMVEQELEFPQSQEIDIIVPTKAVNELSRLWATRRGRPSASPVQPGRFDLGRQPPVSKLIDGNYPNYRQVIPGESKERIPLEREVFQRAISRVSLLPPTNRTPSNSSSRWAGRDRRQPRPTSVKPVKPSRSTTRGRPSPSPSIPSSPWHRCAT
jgi:DNA polymerase-3 subunit beta